MRIGSLVTGLILSFLGIFTPAQPLNINAAEVPQPWQHQDIGATTAAGDASYESGTFTVIADGTDIWGAADAFHYVYQQLQGDGEISARVVSLENTHEWAKAGVMIRESLEAGSKHAQVVITPGNGTSFQYRPETGSESQSETSGDGLTAPVWLRISRSGDTFTTFKSTDGDSWTEVGSVNIAMEETINIGLCLTSHSDGVLSEAVFEDIYVDAGQPMPPEIITHPQSQSVTDGERVELTVDASGSMPLHYQWNKNSQSVPDATNNTLVLDPVHPDDAADYTVIVTNQYGSVTSDVATLTVSQDTVSPSIVAAACLNATEVRVEFSELVDQASATAVDNYQLNNGASILAAAMEDDGKSVILATTSLSDGVEYTLTVNDVTDRSSTANSIAPDTQATFTANIIQQQGLLREVYYGSTSELDSLLNLASFPDNPDSTGLLTNSFEAPADINDNYGQRVRGYIVPPETGEYVFWIASDDNSALYLSSDDQPSNKAQIASVDTWTASRQWNKEPNQQSAPQQLNSGMVYYIEALMSEGTGGDNLAVRWELPDGTMEEPIPASRLLPWGTAFSAPVIAVEPQDQTAVEGGTAVFSVELSSIGPANYQWMKNGAAIPGATAPELHYSPVKLLDDGASFKCLISNSKGTVSTRNATLSVTPDITQPELIAAQNIGTTNLQVKFSEPVSEVTGADPSNYTVTPGISVVNAAYGDNDSIIILTLTPMTYGETYTLTVNGVQDQAVTPNTIESDSQITFTASEYAPRDIGAPAIEGEQTSTDNGFKITAGGTGFQDNQDQFHFSYQKRTGDFDIQVRVTSMSHSDSWARGGLMVRESLDAASPFAAVFSTPGALNGCFFQFRQNLSGTPSRTGRAPANYPYTYLRLKRQGNTFTGYASVDGRLWSQLGSANIDLPETILFGMAAASYVGSTPIDVGFNNIQDTVNTQTGRQKLEREPLGPSTRRTGLVFSEIMYHPQARADGKETEFIEIYNSENYPIDISGYRLAGGIDYVVPENTILPAGAFIVIAPVPADVKASYNITNVIGGFDTRLANDGEIITLVKRSGAVILTVEYSDASPWPVAADGAGHSLVLAKPSYGERFAKAWAASSFKGGSPGRPNPVYHSLLKNIVINEFLAHTDEPQLDYIELYNHGNTAVDISGCLLSDNRNTNKFRIPEGTTLEPREFIAWTQDTLGFALDASGEDIYLTSPDNSSLIDAVRFSGQENGVSVGRYPDGAPRFIALAETTMGTTNSTPFAADIVINELMFHPVWSSSVTEYVELFNRSDQPVDLSGWRFIDGIDFTMPENSVIEPNGYFVIAKDESALLSAHPELQDGNVAGNFGGRLSNQGERLKLVKPEPIIGTNDLGQWTTNIAYVVVDDIAYEDGGRWCKWADGGGSSMELIDPYSDNNFAANWADSDETAKSQWTTIEHTGVMDLGRNDSDELQLFMLETGECLIDDVEVIPDGGTNIIENSTFDSGLSPWVPQGTHDKSYVQTSGGWNDSPCLRVIGDGRGDNGANRIRIPLNTTLTAGQTVTLRAKVRWLTGHSEVLLRLYGNWLELPGKMPVPGNLGTPGKQNSKFISNAGPAIYDVSHYPVLPQNGEPVTVTARLNDPDGILQGRVVYRIDPSTDTDSIVMHDDGAAGDAVAGDGLYSAIIPGQSSGTTVAFHIVAGDKADSIGTSTFPKDAPDRECLIRFGEAQPDGNLGVYRIWITQEIFDEWSNRLKIHNGELDCTFTYGDIRAIYNAKTLYSGSPWLSPGYNTPTGSLCGYELITPKDDLLLGVTDYVLDWPIHDTSNPQHEQATYWMADQLGIQNNRRRYVILYVNGVRRGNIYEDAQQPNGEEISEWSPNQTDGHLFKIEDWFEFDDNANKEFNVDATLQNFTTTGGKKKVARYRWNWKKRSVDTSASDYSKLFKLVDTVNIQDPSYTKSVFNLVDIDQWMRAFAVEHIAGNWDSYGFNRGKNMYAYKPETGKWRLMLWDIDFAFDAGGTINNFFGTSEPIISRMYNHPPFRRAYLRALHDAAYGPMLADNINPYLEAKYRGLRANEIDVQHPANTEAWIANQRNNILSVLSGVETDFAVSNNNGDDFSTNTSIIELEGAAPVNIKTIRINGIEYPLEWTSVNTWKTKIALSSGTNSFNLTAYDSYGNLISNATDSINIEFTGEGSYPEVNLIINELMYHPASTNAEFIELYNSSPDQTFDLSNFEFEGLSYTFPPGTIIGPDEYLVLAEDLNAFTEAYGSSITPFDAYPGKLNNDGETISLVKPGLTPELNVVIDKVDFNDAPPWPTNADGLGPSLQLIDYSQDNDRVGNWAADDSVVTNVVLHPITYTSEWKYDDTGTDLGAEWRESDYNDDTWASGEGLLYVEDSPLPQPKNTPLTLGPPTTYFRTTFTNETGSATATLRMSTIIDDGAVFYLNGEEIHRLRVSTDPVEFSTFADSGINNAAQEGPFEIQVSNLKPGVNVLAVEVHQINAGSSDIVFGLDLEIEVAGGAPFTPGAPNSVRANLEPFPPVWINEIMPENLESITDSYSERDPWIELYNSGTEAVDLTGYFMTDSYTNLNKWAFPDGTTIQPGEFKVIWADNQPEQTTAGELHADITLHPTNGVVALTRIHNITPAVATYMNYDFVSAGRSFGEFPDGIDGNRQQFDYPTPGSANNGEMKPIQVFINEWMAANNTTLADPADGDFDDWFELYNAGNEPVDLSDYALSDSLTNSTEWIIPEGTIIQPKSFLLVWADSETGQNGFTNQLHADFNLNADGEAIGFFEPTGALVDGVSFGTQTNDISQGRYPDGAGEPFVFFNTPTPASTNSVPQQIDNLPPNISPVDDQNINEGETLNLNITASDPDDPAQTLTFSLADGATDAAPEGAVIDPDTGEFTWTPTEAQGPGVYSITIRVTDDGEPSRSTTTTFEVVVSEINTPPNITEIPDQIIDEESQLTINVQATDADIPAQTMTFGIADGAPNGILIDPKTGTLSWTPSEAQGPGTYSITVTAFDNGTPALSSSSTFTVTVNEINLAPAFRGIENQEIDELETLTVNPVVDDRDDPAQTLTFGFPEGAPDGAVIDPGTGEFTWTPTEAQGPSTNSITIEVTDNGTPALSDSVTFDVVVNEVNEAPVLDAIQNQSVDELTALTLTAAASDNDAPSQTLTFSLADGAPDAAPDGAAIDPDTGEFTWTPTEAQGPSTNSITIEVTDDATPELSDSVTFDVVVNEVNEAPVITQQSDKEIQPEEELQLSIEADDTDLPKQALEFSLDEAPENAAIDPDTGEFTWTPDASFAQTTNTITVIVTDDGEPVKSDSMGFLVIVGGTISEIEITRIQVSDAAKIILRFRANPGRTYQVQSRENIDDTGWNDIGEPITATEEYVEFTDDTPISGSRFYRIKETE